MAFAVPADHADVARQVFNKFRNLVACRAIDLVTTTAIDAWRRNFGSAEEEYLAAHLLSSSVIRTERMKQSSYRRIIEMIIPDVLRSAGLWNFPCVESMELAFRPNARPTQIPLRFMPVDGQHLDQRPGNSGDSILREFGIHARVGDPYFIRADAPDAWDNPPAVLILLDDLLGTGAQFDRFATAYRLAELSATTQCVYVPLLAAVRGIETIEAKHPRIDVRPVEVLAPSSQFFSESTTSPGIWARDNHNTAADARQFYEALMQARGVGREGQHSLELTVLLPGRTPNSTLKAYWAEHATWTPLLRR